MPRLRLRFIQLRRTVQNGVSPAGDFGFDVRENSPPDTGSAMRLGHQDPLDLGEPGPQPLEAEESHALVISERDENIAVSHLAFHDRTGKIAVLGDEVEFILRGGLDCNFRLRHGKVRLC